MFSRLRDGVISLFRGGSLGRRGERLACGFLRRRGLRIVGRNVRARRGEIDIVAEDGASLVFVEVKARTHSGAVERTGLERLDARKCRALRRSCRLYARRLRRAPESLRLDVVTVEFEAGSAGRKVRDIRWYPGFLKL